MWFTCDSESEQAKPVSIDLLQGAYSKIKKDWVQAETGYSQSMIPAEYFSRPLGGFVMMLKQSFHRQPKYQKPLEKRPVTQMEFIAHSPEVLETMILEEAGLPFDREKVQVVNRTAGKIGRLPKK